MAYIVAWKKLPGKSLVSSEVYQTLDEALTSAKIVMIGGPGPVEITVTGDDGKVHDTRIVDNA